MRSGRRGPRNGRRRVSAAQRRRAGAFARALTAILLLAAASGSSGAQEAFPLVGLWNCQSAALRSQIVFQPNGQYSAQAVSPMGYNITHWGRWRMVGPNWARLSIEDWSPRVFMGNRVLMPSEDNFMFQPIGPNHVAAADGTQCVRGQ